MLLLQQLLLLVLLLCTLTACRHADFRLPVVHTSANFPGKITISRTYWFVTIRTLMQRFHITNPYDACTLSNDPEVGSF